MDWIDQGLPVRSSFHLTLILVMMLRVCPLTDLKRCASSAIMVSHLMPRNVELSLSTVSYDVCIRNSVMTRQAPMYLTSHGRLQLLHRQPFSDLWMIHIQGCHEHVIEVKAYQENIKLEGLCPGISVVELMLTNDLPISLASSVLQHILQTNMLSHDKAEHVVSLSPQWSAHSCKGHPCTLIA